MRAIAVISSLLALASSSFAADVQSISRLTFGPENTLFVADWKGVEIHALSLPPTSGGAPGQIFNMLDLETRLSNELGGVSVKLEDIAVRPGTGEVYVGLSYGPTKIPALLAVTADQKIRRVDLKTTKSTSVKLKSANNSQWKFWNDIPERSLTVTDMKWRDGDLYVAGLSNQDFASTLRRIAYPFTEKQSMASVEIYHTSHNQIETRAPIRAMAFASWGGKSYLVAAYTCTPLVTIALEDLKDGAHVHGKTIAELGYGNTPADLIAYTGSEGGKTQEYLLLVNYQRASNIIPVAEIAAANAKPGMDKPVPFGSIAGLQPMQAPLAGTMRIANLDESSFVVLRRQLEKGTLELVSVQKNAGFRLSDFVSEYTFEQYSYSGKDFQLKYLKPVQDAMMKQEGYAELVKP